MKPLALGLIALGFLPPWIGLAGQFAGVIMLAPGRC